MNLKQFRYALTLANEGSFSRAAEVLGISQPSLSQYIKKLESETGVPLFERSGQTVRLTDAGRIYIEAGRTILDVEKRMQAGFSDLAAYKTGTLTVGAAPYRSAGLMPAACAEFRRLYPGISLVIDERGSRELLEGVSRSEFDFAVTALPVDESLFDCELLHREEILLAMPKDSALDTRLAEAAVTLPGRLYPAVDLALADGADFVMITEGQAMQQLLEDLCAKAGVLPRTSVTVRSLEAQIQMVREGLGAALVPARIERFGGFDRIRYYSLRDTLRERAIGAVWKKGDLLTQAARTFLEILKKY